MNSGLFEIWSPGRRGEGWEGVKEQDKNLAASGSLE